MSLKIIGSGFGRTGTRTLKEALETLGFGPCHHMEEVFANPGQVPFWQAIAAGEDVDLAEVFDGYVSQVDWPGAHVWRELAIAFPDAKVIHSTRPEEAWWASFSRTIGKLIDRYQGMPLPPHVRDMLDVGKSFVAEATFDGKIADKASAIAAFRARQAEVEAAIPADQLLVYDVAQGWEPLCAFLGVAVPEVDFPHRNRKDDFWAVLGGEPA